MDRALKTVVGMLSPMACFLCQFPPKPASTTPSSISDIPFLLFPDDDPLFSFCLPTKDPALNAPKIDFVATSICGRQRSNAVRLSYDQIGEKFLGKTMYKAACFQWSDDRTESIWTTPMILGDNFTIDYMCARMHSQPHIFEHTMPWDSLGVV